MKTLLLIFVCCTSLQAFATPEGRPLPFDRCAYIDVYAYPNRKSWISPGGGYEPDMPEAVRDGKLVLDSSRIRQRLRLMPPAVSALKALVQDYTCQLVTAAGCYYPRHLFVFYDSADQAMAFMELCFSCSRSVVSDGYENPEWCAEKLGALQFFLFNSGQCFFKPDFDDEALRDLLIDSR